MRARSSESFSRSSMSFVRGSFALIDEVEQVGFHALFVADVGVEVGEAIGDVEAVKAFGSRFAEGADLRENQRETLGADAEGDVGPGGVGLAVGGLAVCGGGRVFGHGG